MGVPPLRLLSPDDVRAFAEALARVGQDDLAGRFDPSDMLAKAIYPEIWDRDPSDDDTLGHSSKAAPAFAGSWSGLANEAVASSSPWSDSRPGGGDQSACAVAALSQQGALASGHGADDPSRGRRFMALISFPRLLVRTTCRCRRAWRRFARLRDSAGFSRCVRSIR